MPSLGAQNINLPNNISQIDAIIKKLQETKHRQCSAGKARVISSRGKKSLDLTRVFWTTYSTSITRDSIRDSNFSDLFPTLPVRNAKTK